MPLGKELSHLVEEQIKKSSVAQTVDGGTGSVSASGSNNGDKMALIEANVQRLAEQLAQMVSTQKKSKRNQIEYGLEVHALHGMRIAVTSGQATFKELEEPLDCPFMYLELSPSLSGRQIRYIYLTQEATLVESTTDPADMEEYIPLAMVDIWAGITEITEDKVQDIRPRANGVTGDFKAKELVESILTGNVTVFSTDTGKDSFVIRETAPPSMKVYVTSGRALVDGEVINAEGGELDLSGYRKVEKEYVGIGDGEKTAYSLYHQHVTNVTVFVAGEEKEVVVDEEVGNFSFASPIEEGLEIRASYEFTGSCMAVFFVEKIYADTGKPLGIIGWFVGSNRTPQEPPKLLELQHVIGKAELSDVMTTIIDTVIDNSYEVVNLNQEELQYGERLGSTSLQDGAIIARKISANAIIGDHIAAGSIDSAKIVSGAIEAQHISAGAILAEHIGANTITVDTIKAGTISADKFESNAFGDLTQAIRYVKSVLKEQNFWRKPLTKEELASGVLENISYDTEEYPTLRLKNTRQWDPGYGTLPMTNFNVTSEEAAEFYDQLCNYYKKIGELFFLLATDKQISMQQYEAFIVNIDKEPFYEYIFPIYEQFAGMELVDIEYEDWLQSENLLSSAVEKMAKIISKDFIYYITEMQNDYNVVEMSWTGVGGYTREELCRITDTEIKELIKKTMYYKLEGLNSGMEVLSGVFEFMKDFQLFDWYDGASPDLSVFGELEKAEKVVYAIVDRVLETVQIERGEPINPWDTGTWDRPVQMEGWWESPSIDYGKQEDLQAEFWVKPLLTSSDHSIQVKFKYSSDNLVWSDYEEGSCNQAMGYYYWIGYFQNYRYVKIKVEMKTENPDNYEILAYPEVRIASAAQGNVGDIRFPAMTVKPGELKLNGALLQRQDYPLLWSWACENYLVISEAERNANGIELRGLFTNGNGTTTFRIPDVRAQVLRVLPEGHGDDTEMYRRLGSQQRDTMQNATGGFGIADGAYIGSAWGVYSLNGHDVWANGKDRRQSSGVNFNLSNVVRTSNETRMKNIAYFACIRYS